MIGEDKKFIKGEIEGLARIIKGSFDTVDKRFDTMEKIGDDRFRVITEEFDRIRSDICDIKTTLGPLVRVVALQERETMDLRFRVSSIERKVGIKNE